MKSVRIIALRQERKRLLEHLQNSSLIQIKKSDSAPEGFQKIDMTAQTQQFERNVVLTEQALSILNKLSPPKNSLLSSFSGRRIIDPDEIGEIALNSGEIINICHRITELNKKLADYAAEQAKIRTALTQLEPWQNLDIPLNQGDTKSTAIFIGTLPKEYDEVSLSEEIATLNPDLVFEFEIQYTSVGTTYIVIFTPLSQKTIAEEVLRNLGFAKPISPTSKIPKDKKQRLIKKREQLQEESEVAKSTILSYVNLRKDICDTQDYFKIRSEKYEVINQLNHTKNVFVIDGYIPQEDCEKLEKLCNRVATCCIEFGDVSEEEAPVKLKNNAFARPAQSIVTMYSPPSHKDIDPTPLLAFFYYFFFGMMFSDAGYGLLMAVVIGIVLKKFKPDENMYNNLKLFQYCGISTFLWGLVFGSFFGDAPAVLYNYFTGSSVTMAELLPWPIIDPQKDAIMLMVVSIAFGLVHILAGMSCKFYVCLKSKDYKGAFFDTGFWMLLLIGVAILATGFVTSAIVTYIGAGIAIASALGLVFTQGRNKKGFGKVIGGLASLYDITSYVSDLLSYSRLLALGLTTGVMAQVFNMLSTMFGTNLLGIIFLIVIFIAGHAINIGLNALGSYVHTMRLQYVEMFSKFYEGGGEPFKPFSLNSKYIKIQEEK